MKDLQRKIDRITRLVHSAPSEERAEVLRVEIQKLPEAQRTIITATVGLHVATQDGKKPWERHLPFGFGCVFIVVLVVIALMIPNPTQFQILVFRVLLALAAAGIGAIIPGFFNIESKLVDRSFRAGGALGLFAVVFFWNPPSLPKEWMAPIGRSEVETNSAKAKVSPLPK